MSTGPCSWRCPPCWVHATRPACRGPRLHLPLGWELETQRFCDETAAVTSIVFWPQGLLARFVTEACSMDRGAWRATVYGAAKSWTQLSK